jgi:GAF domain-containing protein
VGLLGEVQEAQEARKRARVCGLTRVLRELDEGDAADLVAAMDDKKLMHTTIAEVLVARGFEINDQIISRHRRGQCGCAR